MRGTQSLDSGFLALDIHHEFHTELTPKLMRKRTWHWLLARTTMLLDIDGSLTQKEFARGL